MKNDNKKEIKLIGEGLLAPLIDGHQIVINDDKTEADIIFFQVLPITATEDGISGAPVAHLRLSVDQLKAFIKNATDVLKEK